MVNLVDGLLVVVCEISMVMILIVIVISGIDTEANDDIDSMASDDDNN